ncbi:hypothetical protein FQN51_006269 [Onygenales sp. PD_10]|nr:hypothetical protein FQN51_006269 [Onygenales sp. PD_10]
MRIRYPFAGAFAFLCLLSAYIGLFPHNSPAPDSKTPQTPSTIPLQPNDKVLHLLTFFLLSLTFYWILDTTRRRTLHLTIITCTMTLGIGSELLQAILPNDRSFDPFDVLANIVGSLSAVGLCTWYHKRMIERRRKARFGPLMGDSTGDDVELGVREGELEGQESGVTARTLEQEVDNWDENVPDDWEGEDGEGDELATGTSGEGDGQKTPPSSRGDEDDGVEVRKMRAD